MLKVLTIALAAAAAPASVAAETPTIPMRVPTTIQTLYCSEADPAISLMQRLVAGEMVSTGTLGTGLCGVGEHRATVTAVHTVQRAPDGRTWTLATVSLAGDRIGYILTSLPVVATIET